MANLKDIRKRIVTVKNTQKITRVMCMISASKLHKARQAINKSQPYHHKLQEIFVALCNNSSESLEKFMRQPKQDAKVAVLLLTSDRGLCGAFNSGLCKKLATTIKQKQIDLFIIGKKGKDFFEQEKNFSIIEGHYKKKEVELKNAIIKLGQNLIQKYLTKRYDKIYIAYNNFISSVNQETKIKKFLPLDLEAQTSKENLQTTQQALFEPSLQQISNQLIPSYLENLCYLCLLDSVAGEHASRMRVMDAATNNARDLITKLQMQYNRARQANITTELTEIISGAESV